MPRVLFLLLAAGIHGEAGEVGTLCIESATSLPNSDSWPKNPKPDAYAVVQDAQQSALCQTASKEDYNGPAWNHCCEDVTMAQVDRVVVFDKDMFANEQIASGLGLTLVPGTQVVAMTHGTITLTFTPYMPPPASPPAPPWSCECDTPRVTLSGNAAFYQHCKRGNYVRMDGVTKAGRAVYKQELTCNRSNYLFYHGQVDGGWRIGPDYEGLSSGIQSLSGKCPETSGPWGYYQPHFATNEDGTLFHFADGTLLPLPGGQWHISSVNVECGSQEPGAGYGLVLSESPAQHLLEPPFAGANLDTESMPVFNSKRASAAPLTTLPPAAAGAAALAVLVLAVAIFVARRRAAPMLL